MKEIIIETNIPYKILIDENLLQYSGEYIKKMTSANKVLFITDDIVNKLYFDSISKSLQLVGFKIFLFVIPHGEASKNLQMIEEIYTYLYENKFTRADLIISLGGGVVGDIAGFAAATYMRGIDFIQIPTTLLAQIDSSIGGKTGVNLPQGKNLVGAFHQPRLVLIDPNVLSTLPEKIINDGIAEAIKYGVIKNASLFYKIRDYNLSDISQDIIYECIKIKKALVEKDEFDLSERKLLNFGHTLGHAIEKFYNYSLYSHGEAVAIGMAQIVFICEKLGLTKKGSYKQLCTALSKYNLPSKSACKPDELIQFSAMDKKSIGEYIDIVIIKAIGEGYVKRILKSDLKRYIGG